MRISINAISGRPEYGAIVWICNDGVLQDKEGRENLRQLRHFNSNLHGTWKEEKKGGRQGAGRDGVPPLSIAASLATQVNIGCLNWIISSKGKDYRESGRKSRFIESLKWDKKKIILCHLHGNRSR